MKYIFTLLLCFGFLLTTTSYGQVETKKVVVIKKIKDADGNTTTERQEASGEEADALIKKMKEDGTLEGIDIDVEIEKSKKECKPKSVSKEVKIQKIIKDGKETKKYKIVTEENGEKKVMEWTGDGEMPEEMAKILESEEVEVHINKKGGDEKEVYEIITEDGDEKKVMFWNGDGEIPADMAKVLKDVEITKSADGEHITIKVETQDDSEHAEIHEAHKMDKKIRIKSENKVTLGVMIADDSNGVVLSNVIDDSVAEKAGLKSGDTILKIDDTYVFNTDMLLKALSKFDKGNTAKVTFLRGGKEKKVKANF